MIDPYDDTVGYRVPLRSAGYTLITHAHADHANMRAVTGPTHVVAGSGRRGNDAFPVRAVLLPHDDRGGAERGLVNGMCFSMDGVRVCHLSDLGDALDESQAAEIGPVDLLLVPVGGAPYTIDGVKARSVVERLAPRAVIPMHYMTPQTNRRDFPIAGVELFLEGFKSVERVRSGVLELTEKTLPLRQTVYVLTNTC